MDITAEAERTLVGSILLDPDKLVKVAEILSAEDMVDQQAKTAYLIAVGLWKEKKNVDLTSVAMADTSLVAYLTSAISDGATIGVEDKARSIALQAKQRRINAGLDYILKSQSPVEERLDDLLRLYQSEMFVSSKSPYIKDVLERVDKYVKDNKERGCLGVSTGFRFFDDIYMQYVPGHIWTMGGFTSAGKTAMMTQKLCNLIRLARGVSIVVVSTEMTEEQMVARIIANYTGIYSQKILSGNLHQGEYELVAKAMRFLNGKSLKIYDDIYTLNEIETVFRKADLQGGVDVGFVDYVQNCQVPDAKSEYQENSRLAKGLQKLAKDVKCTLICLSQVSNDVGRGNTDQFELKGGGEWAAVSDVGIMLNRSKKDKYKLKYTIKKNRHGPVSSHIFEYMADYTRLDYVEQVEN